MRRVELRRGPRGARTLVLRGEWSLAAESELKGAFARALDVGERRLQLEIDLREVTVLDPEMLARLVSLRRTVTLRKGELTVRCSPGPVHTAIVEARLAGPLNIYVHTH
jgi:anti-anti-sigma regulatory factor